ncbi:DUF3034 family protein [Paraglaciecola mesophila]|uniref:DUF3034 domain-containing protein n=2 Tax=Paraglaciecola mesophila TaxID=197222 RepID=K6ZNE0_9ALTE|nr:DUF3034 family protein [Paraglaciecola mesophila]GAC24860.1 hypothetical protein GMES_2565 [Paraglaciecola mesophila KMM 241]|tara:strand:+ start:7193 stop:8041 length:849 start_codon:yes stop_codon:yes gene_type:complete
MLRKTWFRHSSALLLYLLSNAAFSQEGKLIATAGLVQLEGSGGGGIVPWATLSGYDSRDEVSVSALMTQVNMDDYRLNVLGLSASFYDQVEVSVAQHRFDLKEAGVDIKQSIYGVKYRAYGDVVYSRWPQISIGIQHKVLEDEGIAKAVGANKSAAGTDFYIAATKVHLGALAGYNTVWNLTVRATKANEMGLLGFGGVNNDDYEMMLEASAGILFSRNLAVGIEYRQKPDNLGLGEDDWKDLFITYIPSKHFSVTLAWADLGSIAGANGQDGVYLSLNGQL